MVNQTSVEDVKIRENLQLNSRKRQNNIVTQQPRISAGAQVERHKDQTGHLNASAKLLLFLCVYLTKLSRNT